MFVFTLPRPNLRFSCVLCQIKKFCDYKVGPYSKIILEEYNEQVNESLKKCASKIMYNSILEKKRIAKYTGRTRNLAAQKKNENNQDRFIRDLKNTLPISLKYLSDEIPFKVDESNTVDNIPVNEEKLIHFPYIDANEIEAAGLTKSIEANNKMQMQDVASAADEEVRKRYELQKEMKNWMTSYDNFDDTLVEDKESEDLQNWEINYGTPDPKSKISNIPCGGCGALLHCKDTAIPGYIPSEIYKNQFSKGGSNLQSITCQRCHFLKYYNLALQMRVTPEDYPKVLQTVSEKQGIVVLMVDLLDFPCSIWPGIADIFGHKVPIVVVGNKVDLLPKDSKTYLQTIKKTLLENIKLSGFATLNIKHVALISAKTGFGVEDLITKLNSLYTYKGDFYIVGSTNVGKSSLFNALIQSDFCKVQAADLIQRATTSVWPGTTLNLLKFPIKRPAGYTQYLRHKRLLEANKINSENDLLRLQQLRKTKDAEYATLIGNIGITENPHSKKIEESKDYFNVQGHANASGKLEMGIDESLMDYKYSKWCFDTPGVVQTDQIIHLLTTEELLLTLPKELILPRTLCIKPGCSLFIAGLARLDYLEGEDTIRFTVFASNELPITVCNIEDSEQVYQDLLRSDLFKVPINNGNRLVQWKNLELAQKFTIVGDHWKKSANDVVLSSAGWIAISGRTDSEYKFQAWTPEKRGVYIRDCLLPYAVALSGSRIKHTIACKKYKFFLQQ